MKKALILLAFCLFILVSCSEAEKPAVNPDSPIEVPAKTPVDEPNLPENEPLEFIGETVKLIYASGAGAWSSDVTLFRDGTFKGEYHDSNMGETGEGFPDGSVYLCNWAGSFENIVEIDDYTYSMTIKEIECEFDGKEPWIEDGIKFIPSGPNGFSENIGAKCLLCLPGKPLDSIPEEVLWSNMRYVFGDRVETELSQFCLYFPDDSYSAFYSYDD